MGSETGSAEKSGVFRRPFFEKSRLNTDGVWKPALSMLITLILISIVVFGQNSDPSSPASPDVPPAVYIVAPLYNETISGKGIVIGAFDPADLVTSAWFEIDGTKAGDLLAGNNYSGEFDSTQFTDGDHSFSIHGCINSACAQKEIPITIQNQKNNLNEGTDNSVPTENQNNSGSTESQNQPGIITPPNSSTSASETPPENGEKKTPMIQVKGSNASSALTIDDLQGNVIGSGTGAVAVEPGKYNLEINFLETNLQKFTAHEAVLDQSGLLLKVNGQIDPKAVVPVNDDSLWISLISIARNFTFSAAEFSGITPENTEAAYYCSNWNSENSSCLTNWIDLGVGKGNAPFAVLLNSSSAAIGFARDKNPPLLVKGSNLDSALTITDEQGNTIASGSGTVKVAPGTYTLAIDLQNSPIQKIQANSGVLNQNGELFHVNNQPNPASVPPVDANTPWISIVSIQPNISFSSGSISGVTPTGTGTAYFCDQWNEESLNCSEGWKDIHADGAGIPFASPISTSSSAIGFASQQSGEPTISIEGSSLNSSLLVNDLQGNKVAEGTGTLDILPGTYNVQVDFLESRLQTLQAGAGVLKESGILFTASIIPNSDGIPAPNAKLEWSEIDSLSPSISFSSASLSGIIPEGTLAIDYCDNWNDSAMQCAGSWKDIGVHGVGKPYSLSLSSGVSAIGFAGLKGGGGGSGIPTEDTNGEDTNNGFPIPDLNVPAIPMDYVSVTASNEAAAINVFDANGSAIATSTGAVEILPGNYNTQLDFLNSEISHVNFDGMFLDHNGEVMTIQHLPDSNTMQKVYDDSSQLLKKIGGIIPKGAEKQFADAFSKPVHFMSLFTVKTNYDFNAIHYIFNVPAGATTLWYCNQWDDSTGDCGGSWEKKQDITPDIRRIDTLQLQSDYMIPEIAEFAGGGGSGGFGFGGSGFGPTILGPAASNEISILMDTNTADMNLDPNVPAGGLTARLRHIQDTNFVADRNYLLLAGSFVDTNIITNNGGRCNIAMGAGPGKIPSDYNVGNDLNEIRAATVAALTSHNASAWWYFSFTKWTAVAGYSVDLNVTTMNSAICEFKNAFLAAIPLNSLDENSDWFYDVNHDVIINSGVPNAPQCLFFCDINQVGSRITFTPDGVSDYLVLGEAQMLLDSATANVMSLMDINYGASLGAGSRLAYAAEGSRNVNDQIILSTIGVLNHPAATPLMVKVRTDGNNVNDHNSSRLFILRLNAFDSYDYNSLTNLKVHDSNTGGLAVLDTNQQITTSLTLKDPGNVLAFWSVDQNLASGIAGDMGRIYYRVRNYVDNNLDMNTPMAMVVHNPPIPNGLTIWRGASRAVTNFDAFPLLDGLKHDFNLAVDQNRSGNTTPSFDTNFATVVVFSAKLVDGNMDLNITSPNTDGNTDINVNTSFRVDGNTTCRDDNCTVNGTTVDTNLQYCVGSGCSGYVDINTVSTSPLYLVSGSQTQSSSSLNMNASYTQTWIVQAIQSGTYELRTRGNGGGVDANTSLNGVRTITVNAGKPDLNITIPPTDSNNGIALNINFRVDGNTTCRLANCATVDTNLQYCVGQDCVNYYDINTDSLAPLYIISGGNPQSSSINLGQNYTQTWTIKPTATGVYELRTRASGTSIDTNNSMNGDHTITVNIRGKPDLNIYVPNTDANASIDTNQLFEVDGNTTCRNTDCATVDSNIQYCVGQGCTNYYDMNTVSTAPIFIVTGGNPQSANLDVNRSTSQSWKLKAIVAGTFELRTQGSGNGSDTNNSMNGDRTITIANAKPDLVITSPNADDNAMIRAGINFRVDGNTTCRLRDCNVIDTNIQFCAGLGCTTYYDLNTDSTQPLYLVSGGNPQSSGVLQVGQNYTQSWTVAVTSPGNYELRTSASSALGQMDANTSSGGTRTIVVQNATANEDIAIFRVTTADSGIGPASPGELIDVNSHGATNYFSLGTIKDSNFNAGNDYIILATSIHDENDVNNQLTTVIGTGTADTNALQFVNTRQFQAPPDPAPSGWQYTAFTKYTAAAGTDINYVMKCNSGSNGNWCGAGEIFLMSFPLSGLDKNVDYWYDDNITAIAPMNDTFAQNVGTTITFTPDGVSDYLVLGTARIINHNRPHSGSITRMEINDGTQRSFEHQGGSALTDTPVMQVMHIYQAPAASSKTVKLRFRGFGTNDLNSSAMFILRLNAFDSHDENVLTGPIHFSAADQNLVSVNFATLGDRNVIMFHGQAYKHNTGTLSGQRLAFTSKVDSNIFSQTDQNMLVGWAPGSDENGSDKRFAIGFDRVREGDNTSHNYAVTGIGSSDGSTDLYDLNQGYLAVFTTTRIGIVTFDINAPTADENTTINVDTNFLVQGDVNCTRNNCGSVDANLQYCFGRGCTSYVDVNSDSNSTLYFASSSNPVTQTVNKDQNLPVTWILKARRAGVYELRIKGDGTISDTNQTTNGAKTIVIQPTASTMSFTLSLPSSGCTTGKGNFDGSGACQRAYFSAGSPDSNQVQPEGQNSTTPFFVYDNQSSVGNDMNIIIDFNTDLNSGTTLKAAQSATGYSANCSGNPINGCITLTGRRATELFVPVEDEYIYKGGVPVSTELQRAVFMKFDLNNLPRKIAILNAQLQLTLRDAKSSLPRFIFMHMDANQDWRERDSASDLKGIHTGFSIVSSVAAPNICYNTTGDQNCDITRLLSQSFEQGDVNFSFRLEDADNNGTAQDTKGNATGTGAILRLGDTSAGKDINFDSAEGTSPPILYILYGFGNNLGTAIYTSNTQDLNIFLYSDFGNLARGSSIDRNAVSKGIPRN